MQRARLSILGLLVVSPPPLQLWSESRSQVACAAIALVSWQLSDAPVSLLGEVSLPAESRRHADVGCCRNPARDRQTRSSR